MMDAFQAGLYEQSGNRPQYAAPPRQSQPPPPPQPQPPLQPLPQLQAQPPALPMAPPAAPSFVPLPQVQTVASPVRAEPGCPTWVVALIVGFAVVVLVLVLVCVMWDPFKLGRGGGGSSAAPELLAALPSEPFWTDDKDINYFIRCKMQQEPDIEPSQAKAWAEGEVERQRAALATGQVEPRPGVVVREPKIPPSSDLLDGYMSPVDMEHPRLVVDPRTHSIVEATRGTEGITGATPLPRAGL